MSSGISAGPRGSQLCTEQSHCYEDAQIEPQAVLRQPEPNDARACKDISNEMHMDDAVKGNVTSSPSSPIIAPEGPVYLLPWAPDKCDSDPRLLEFVKKVKKLRKDHRRQRKWRRPGPTSLAKSFLAPSNAAASNKTSFDRLATVTLPDGAALEDDDPMGLVRPLRALSCSHQIKATAAAAKMRVVRTAREHGVSSSILPQVLRRHADAWLLTAVKKDPYYGETESEEMNELLDRRKTVLLRSWGLAKYDLDDSPVETKMFGTPSGLPSQRAVLNRAMKEKSKEDETMQE